MENRNKLTPEPIKLPPRVFIRLIPGLCSVALKQGLDKQLALWYCLRAINHWGSGRLNLAATVDCLRSDFHYSWATTYRILATSTNVFWSIVPATDTSGSIIQIHGVERVLAHFGVDKPGYPIEVALKSFVSDGKDRVSRQWACLYSSIHHPVGINALPISRATLESITGVDSRTQRRYDRKVTDVHPNFALVRNQAGKLTPWMVRYPSKNHEIISQKQRPNTYHCQAKQAPMGMLRKIRHSAPRSFERDEACVARRYFTTPHAFIKCRNRSPDAYLLLKDWGEVGQWAFGGYYA